MTKEQRASLNRVLVRLGHSTFLTAPDIYIEHELALAVERFGIYRVFSRILKNKWYWF